MTIPVTEPDSDTDLLAAVRSGDTAAYGTLYERHRSAARQLAYGLAHDPADAEDLVAETFAKVFASLRAGRGPLVAFRAYLHTTMRHVCYHRARADRRLEFTDDLTRYDEGLPFTDPALDRLERGAAVHRPVARPARAGVRGGRLPQTAAALAGRALADRGRGQHTGRGGGRA